MDALDLVRYFSALALVLGLLGLAFVAARKYGLAGVMAPHGLRRLMVSESLMLDARHKAFLLKRDGIEHLVICGPNGAITVESGIVRGGDETVSATIVSLTRAEAM